MNPRNRSLSTISILTSAKAIKRIVNSLGILFIGLHISAIIIGGINFGKCPADHKIPISLVALGIYGTLDTMFFVSGGKTDRITLTVILGVIWIAITIYMAYLVYSAYLPEFEDMAADAYCDRTVFVFAFIYTTIALGCTFLYGYVSVKYLHERYRNRRNFHSEDYD